MNEEMTLEAAVRVPADYDPYEELANAIIIQAVNDYRDSVAGIEAIRSEVMNGALSDDAKERYLQRAKELIKTIREIRAFMESPWFATLTDCDRGMILCRLKGAKAC